MGIHRTFKYSKAGLLSLCVAAAVAQAQTENAEGEQAGASMEEVLVTGYRGSLLNSTLAKKESVGFSDEVFADDIGKMPSQNLAESLSRIPGVRISREVTGEGQQISVRGLGSSFTKVVMNGNSIAVASDGSLGAGARGRHVDLDMFPPELFSSLAVNKTSTAQQVEGGVSGYVNMRTMRASDMGEGSNFRFGLEGAYNEMSAETSPKLSLMYGNSNDKFGILAGVVHKQHKSRTDGFETVGNYQSGCVAEWYGTNDADGNPERGCVDGSEGWNVFHYANYATADYAAANAGVNVGDPIDINAISGLTDEQLDNFGMPYIARPMYTFGDRDSTSAILALEFSPNDDIDIALDVLHAQADRSFLRNELMHIYRRNYLQYGLEWIPEDIQLSDDNVLESGSFYNSRAWVGSRLYDEELTYTSIMPSLSWQISDLWSVDVAAARTESSFERDEPYLLYYSPVGKLYFAYDQDFPTVQYQGTDVARAGDGWTFGAGPGIQGNEVQAGSFRFQRNARDTETSALHVDFAFGENPDINGIKLGLAWDENISDMTGFSGGDAWNDRVVNSDLDENFANYVVDSPITDLGGSVSGYKGIKGIASVDWSAVKDAVDYRNFVPDTSSGGDQFGQTIGDIDETIIAGYVEVNTEAEIGNRPMRTNLGVRLVSTEQKVATVDAETKSDYTRVLPSFSAVYDVLEDIKVRASASRSLTRANPSSMFPDVSWGSSSIDSVNAGNPFLQPFESTNFDIGGEWYFGELGYVGLTYYEKDITGFTREEDVQVQFLELADYGVDISDDVLSDTQRDALDQCGGRASADCVSTVTTDVNIDGVVKLSGWEVIWVMPLDMWLPGLGFNTSMNKIDQDASDPDAEITGISDTINFTAYYENEHFQTRITYTGSEETEAGGGWSPLLGAPRKQIDLSASYNLPLLQAYNLTLTFDAYNLTNEPLHSYFESDGNTFDIRYPGATYTFGIRGSF